MNDQPITNTTQNLDPNQGPGSNQNLLNPKKIKTLTIAKKIVAFGLIFFSLYHVYETAKEIRSDKIISLLSIIISNHPST